jgi:mRNA-degrading endonuclease toxin of MazEF toxin-antitoxin module
MGVIRQDVVYRFDDPAVGSLQRGDRLVVARSSDSRPRSR